MLVVTSGGPVPRVGGGAGRFIKWAANRDRGSGSYADYDLAVAQG